MSENEIQSDSDFENEIDSSAKPESSDQAARKIVADTVAGVNFRKNDNKFQAIWVLVSIIVLAIAGSILAIFIPSWQLPWYGGALAGAFAWMVVGIFSSGIFLMIYRAVMHLKGKHD